MRKSFKIKILDNDTQLLRPELFRLFKSLKFKKLPSLSIAIKKRFYGLIRNIQFFLVFFIVEVHVFFIDVFPYYLLERGRTVKVILSMFRNVDYLNHVLFR
jgi:hypothetical protein